MGKTLAEVLPEPQASLAQGIVLGLRSNIPTGLKENFSRTGTAHLLAISGLHLSIVAGIFLSLGLWLFGRRRFFYIWLALGIVWLYALMTGLHAPVVRGAIMASLFLSAELLGRQRSAITALAFAAALMVAISPQVLWTASFQMSFLAMTGLILIFPKLQPLGRRAVRATLGENGKLAAGANFLSDGFSVSLAAILATWPLIAYYFGIVSFVGPLATLLALPALPGIIITGALTGGLGLIIPIAAQATGWLAWLFLSYLLLVVNAFAALPISALEAGTGNTLLVWIYYPALATALWLHSQRDKLAEVIPRATASLKTGMTSKVNWHLPAKWVIPPLLIIAVLLSLTAAAMPDDKLHVSVLDVGQGDAILIQTPARQDILIDGGPDPQAVILELGRKMPFWDRTIDLVILTHPHADHVTGLIEVLKRYRVKQVLYPDLDYDSPTYQAWLKLIDSQDIKITIARTGQRINLGGGAVARVITPSLSTSLDEYGIDNQGVVLELAMAKINFLLTADIGYERELELISQRDISPCTVLKVAHHGSDTSTTAEFLATASPRLAVISMGTDNRFGHPSPEVIARLEALVGPERIFRTDEHGTVEFITDGKRLWVRVERGED